MNAVCRLILVVLMMLSFSGCRFWQKEPEPVSVAPLRSVRHEAVSVRTAEPLKQFSGVSRSASESIMAFQIDGVLERVDVKKGARLKRGERIAALTQETLVSELEAANAQLLQADSEWRSAQSLLERVEQLFEENKSSRSDLESVRASLDRATLFRADAARTVEQLTRQQALTQIVSPDECRVANVYVSEGEKIEAGKRIAQLDCGRAIQVEFDVPEIYIVHFNEGESVSVAFESLPGKRFNAVIRDVGVAKMGVFPTFPVSVRLTESAAGIRPGMSATVEAYLSDTEEMAEPVYLVPLKALMKDRDSVYLFLVRPLASREAGLVVRQNVQVGAVSGHLIEVVSGVKAEDRVITAGLHSVHDGLQVKMTPFNGGIQ